MAPAVLPPLMPDAPTAGTSPSAPISPDQFLAWRKQLDCGFAQIDDVFAACMAEAHAKPGFATLAGLVLYAAAEPVDIRTVGPGYSGATRYSGLGMLGRVYRALRDYF